VVAGGRAGAVPSSSLSEGLLSAFGFPVVTRSWAQHAELWVAGGRAGTATSYHNLGILARTG